MKQGEYPSVRRMNAWVLVSIYVWVAILSFLMITCDFSVNVCTQDIIPQDQCRQAICEL